MPEVTANLSRRPDLLPDALLSELRERANERRSKLMECLGQGARSDPGRALVDVILAAARYRQFAQLYQDAPTRRYLRSRLTKLRDAVKTASKILGSGDSFLLAALSLGGLAEEEARFLDFGFGSKVQAVLRELEGAVDEVLAAPWLAGPASGQKYGPKGRRRRSSSAARASSKGTAPAKSQGPRASLPGFRRSFVSCTRSRREKWTRH
jgi:hypothetical protein